MSSPRKYASPYLTGIPGLPVATNKTKKRSKTSLTKINDTSTAEVDTGVGEPRPNANTTLSAINPATQMQTACKEPNFDASCGDMEQKIMNDLISGTKSITVSSTFDEKNEDSPAGADEKEATADFTAFSNDSTKTVQNSANGIKQLTAEGDQPKLSVTKEVTPFFSLKSILKKPSLYRMKSKNKEINADSLKKQGKSSKGKGGKVVKENSARAQSKHKIVGVASASKSEMAKPQFISKSSRRRVKAEQPKSEESDEIPLLPKKSVRFSNKVDVHPVPYESRAGTRACDWQRNMLEQRVQTFRQLMKDVGTDEIDLFGSGMLFPGYPYHLPSPNFTLRGSRIRNFKL